MISSKYRFHGHNSLRFVYSNGKSVRAPQLTIKYILNTKRRLPRFAAVVSKKVYKSAVGRNRIRRRIYEYLRQNTSNLNNNYDIVVICTSGELRLMKQPELTALLDELFNKAALYNQP